MTATTVLGPPSDPYITPELTSVGGVLDTTLTISEQLVDIGGGITAKAETINETIPGPTLRLNVDDTVIRLASANDSEHNTVSCTFRVEDVPQVIVALANAYSYANCGTGAYRMRR